MDRQMGDNSGIEEAIGIIQKVDVLGRALTILVAGIPKVFHLSNDCAFFLQPAQPHLLRPGDTARIVYRKTNEGLSARVMQVTSSSPYAQRIEHPFGVGAPHKMTWVLIGIPTSRLAEIAADVDRISGLPGVVCETAGTDA
jgi:hypothetical protein